jgi:hypothetical protein
MRIMKVILINKLSENVTYLKKITMNTQRGKVSGIYDTTDYDESRKFKTADEAQEYTRKYGLGRIYQVHAVDR